MLELLRASPEADLQRNLHTVMQESSWVGFRCWNFLALRCRTVGLVQDSVDTYSSWYIFYLLSIDTGIYCIYIYPEFNEILFLRLRSLGFVGKISILPSTASVGMEFSRYQAMYLGFTESPRLACHKSGNFGYSPCWFFEKRTYLLLYTVISILETNISLFKTLLEDDDSHDSHFPQVGYVWIC